MARIISYDGVLKTLGCPVKSVPPRLRWSLSDS
jgi:hypothetical protein